MTTFLVQGRGGVTTFLGSAHASVCCVVVYMVCTLCGGVLVLFFSTMPCSCVALSLRRVRLDLVTTLSASCYVHHHLHAQELAPALTCANSHPPADDVGLDEALSSCAGPASGQGIHTHTHTHTHTYTHTYIHAYVHTYIQAYATHTYIHAYMHACMHIHIHT